MLTIGELAARTGVSRRMLRHWDEVGLLAPASIDEQTGYRWYTATQAGRVRAIASLRAVGFGLDEIADLLASPLTEGRLTELLHRRADALHTEIDIATARLVEVRRRLAAIAEGRHITMETIELAPLPPMTLMCLRATSDDESEIRVAVEQLLDDLHRVLARHGVENPEIVLTFYGPPGDSPLEVSAGVEGTWSIPELTTVQVPGAAQGVTVQYENGPGGVGDAWITLDSVLLTYELRTTGVHRQRIRPAGPTRLEAQVEHIDTD